MLKLRSEDAWPRLRAIAREHRDPAFVAVSFIGTGAAAQLPLRAGDTLVTRCDEAAVKAGLVDPRELRVYLNRGVDVHAVANLHAKVFVLGQKAFVGSANVSKMSEQGLVEAIAECDAPRFVGACRRFVESLRGNVIDPYTVDSLIPLYRPPKIPAGGARTRRPIQSPLAIVMLEPIDFDEVDTSAVRESREAADAEIDDHETFKLDYFRWSGKVPSHMRKGTNLLCCTAYGPRTITVSPPARVISVKRFRTSRGARAIIYIAARKRFPERPLKRIVSRVPEAAAIRRVAYFRVVRDRELARKLVSMWPSASPVRR